MRTFLHSCVALCLLAAQTTTFHGIALAQDSDGGPVRTDIIVTDWDRALNESAAGQEIWRQIQAAQATLRAEVQSRENALRKEEQEIADLRGTIDAVDFESRVRRFEGKVEQLRQFSQQRNAEIEGAFRNAFGRLSKHAEVVLGDVIISLGAMIAFDRRVVLAHRAADVTELMIEKLNERVQSVPFENPGDADQ